MRYGTYIFRLIDRATKSPIFENNLIGNYRIEPQHGSNVFSYNIYKNDKHICAFDIYGNKNIYGDMRRASKSDQTKIFESLKYLYPMSCICLQPFGS